MSERTKACPAGMKSWSGSVKTVVSAAGWLAFNHGSSLMLGMPMVSLLCSVSVRMVADVVGFRARSKS